MHVHLTEEKDVQTGHLVFIASNPAILQRDRQEADLKSIDGAAFAERVCLSCFNEDFDAIGLKRVSTEHKDGEQGELRSWWPNSRLPRAFDRRRLLIQVRRK